MRRRFPTSHKPGSGLRRTMSTCSHNRPPGIRRRWNNKRRLESLHRRVQLRVRVPRRGAGQRHMATHPQLNLQHQSIASAAARHLTGRIRQHHIGPTGTGRPEHRKVHHPRRRREQRLTVDRHLTVTTVGMLPPAHSMPASNANRRFFIPTFSAATSGDGEVM